MPFTPFHFGAGAAIHSMAPRRISFLAFCACNVVTDTEPLYYMLTHQYPVHRFLHTFVGANVSWAVTLLLFLVAVRTADRLSLPNWFDWRTLKPMSVAIGAALGSYSHVVLDGLSHQDMTPLAPFSDSNPFLGGASDAVVYVFCVVAALIGIIVIGVRRRLRH